MDRQCWKELAARAVAGDAEAVEAAFGELADVRAALERLHKEEERQVRRVRAGFARRGADLRRGAGMLEAGLAAWAEGVLGRGVAGQARAAAGTVQALDRGRLVPARGLCWADVVRRLRVLRRDDALTVHERVDVAALCRMDARELAEAGVLREDAVQYAVRPGTGARATAPRRPEADAGGTPRA